MTRLAGPDVATLLEGLPLAPSLEGEARIVLARAPSKRPAPAPSKRPPPTPKRPPGRPSTMMPALTRKLCRSLRAGLTCGQACRLARLSRRTFHAWLARGEDEWEDELDTPHADFARAVRQAHAEFSIELVRAVRRGGPGWRVTARELERRCPEDYALGPTRLGAQRLAARRTAARAARRGEPINADGFAERFDALEPADCERFARLSGA